MIAAFFWQCTVTAPTQEVNYNQVSVPEEGGIKFVQYTNNDEGAVGPTIGLTNAGILGWYAPALIDVSYDGKSFAFLASKNGNINLFIKNTAGGKTTVQRTFRDNILDMAFSPDGQYIAFTDASSSSHNIFTINATQGAAIQQITSSGNSVGAVYAPQNDKIFFTKSENDRHYIWSFDLSSSLMTQYGEGFTPSLSPDGNNLIVTRNNKTTSKGEIWMIDVVKGQETLLLSHPEKGFSSPKINHDGTKIVCVGVTPASSNRKRNLDIYSFNLDGTGLTQHTFHEGHDVSPVWAPDENAIFFLSRRGNAEGAWNVWKMSFE
ncbi:MAG: hypothetical protein K9J46_10495 [Saprospiraceae bacterium]|nr:hypothetical protein [Saprospiraceae bacterium]MCF8279244.1 hypothetical protein [Bacteroidales bacterium]MCF8441239.1 hypothetical protein [Saprospiraceae bacterium]